MPTKRRRTDYNDDIETRRRKKHTKSRGGCGSCKGKGVKCDETKPTCKRCLNSRLECTYGKTAPKTLHHQYEQTWQISEPRTTSKPTSKTDGINKFSTRAAPLSCRLIEDNAIINTHPVSKSDDESTVSLLYSSPSTQTAVLAVINTTLSIATSRWDSNLSGTTPCGPYELALLDCFQHRTLQSGFGASHIVGALSDQILGLACTHPYLFHIIATLTSMHDRQLNGQGMQKRTPFESYHWAKASSLFNSELSTGCLRGNATALWFTAGLLSATVLCAVETENNVDAAWPLRPNDSPGQDLQWLGMQRGLQRVWKIVCERLENTYPFDARKEGKSPGCIGTGPAHPGFEAIPAELRGLCGFDETTTEESNAYFAPAGCLTLLLPLELEGTDAMRFLIFPNTLSVAFERLLRGKDPIALALLALFYAKACQATWWLRVRAVTECKAVCKYLDIFHAGNESLMRVMEYPKRCCEYDSEVRTIGGTEESREIARGASNSPPVYVWM